MIDTKTRTLSFNGFLWQPLAAIKMCICQACGGKHTHPIIVNVVEKNDWLWGLNCIVSKVHFLIWTQFWKQWKFHLVFCIPKTKYSFLHFQQTEKKKKHSVEVIWFYPLDNVFSTCCNWPTGNLAFGSFRFLPSAGRDQRNILDDPLSDLTDQLFFMQMQKN